MAEMHEEDCKMCKKLFTNKTNIMTDNFQNVMKCMASDVDSSDSFTGIGHGKTDVANLKDKSGSKKKLNIKPDSVLKLLNSDGDSSDNCLSERIIKAKVKETTAALNSLATKPPKVKSVKSLVDPKKHSDTGKPDGKTLLREQYLRGVKKLPHRTNATGNQDKGNSNEPAIKNAGSSHLQNIIDEAMDHFTKLSNNTKALRKAREENKACDISDTKDLEDTENMERNVATERPSSREDTISPGLVATERPSSREDTISPGRVATERPSSREDTISPGRKHLVLPSTDNRTSPIQSCSVSRRKLPHPPAHNRLRCSVTSFVHNSMDSDSSRPNSSADFSDRSDSSNVSRTDSFGSVASSRSGVEKSSVVCVLKDGTLDEREHKIVSKQANNLVNCIENSEGNENLVTECSTDFDQMKIDTETEEHISAVNTDLKELKEVKGKLDYNEDNLHELEVEKCAKSEVSSNGLKVVSNSCENMSYANEVGDSDMHLNNSPVGIKGDHCKKEEKSNLSASELKDIHNVPFSSIITHNLTIRTIDTDSDNSSGLETGKDIIGMKNKTHISRSPSYRKKVMAKARSRYHRQLKSVKCKTGECKGNCGICCSDIYEEVPRSHTSLGVPVEGISEEEFMDQSSPRRACTPDVQSQPLGKHHAGQRSLKRVPVSSRVDVLMSSSLFKKHLTKHEDLLHKHTLSYRKFGMQKAVSNLDLSEGFLLDEPCDHYPLDRKETEEDYLNSSLNLATRRLSNTSRRYSLTGDDIQLPESEEREHNSRKSESNRSKTCTSFPSREEYRKTGNNRVIPSFAEFRQNRSQKRRILPSNTVFKEQNNNTNSHNSEKGTHSERLKQDENSRNTRGSVDVSLAEVSEMSYSGKRLITVDESNADMSNNHVNNSDQSDDRVIPSINSVIEENETVLTNKVMSESGGNVEVANERVSSGSSECVRNTKVLNERTEERSSENVGNIETNNERTEDALSKQVANIKVLNDRVENGLSENVVNSVVSNERTEKPSLENVGNTPVLNERTEEGSSECVGKPEVINEGTDKTAEECKIETAESAKCISVNASLNAEDKSPLSTSEMDQLEIPHRQCFSETDSVGSQEMSLSDLSTSDISTNSVSNSSKERHRKGSKRPRSLISKKASLISLIKESLYKDEKSVKIANRPTVRRGNSLSSLKSENNSADLKDNQERSDSFRSVKSEGSASRKGNKYKGDNSCVNRGGNDDVFAEERHPVVSFGLETDAASETSQDVRESELASQAGSAISESLNSEIIEALDSDCQLEETFEVFDDILGRPKSCKDDSMVFQTPVLRSTSDACDATPEALKKRRERKERPYKSDPFSGTEIVPASKRYYIREERARLGQHRSFANSSREEILDFLDVVSSQGALPPADSFPSLEELNEDDEQNLSDVTTDSTNKLIRNGSTASTDSGVIGQDESHGSQQSSPNNSLTPSQRMSWPDFKHTAETSHMSASCSDLTKPQMEGCLDCGHFKKHDFPTVLQICSRCYHRRVERKKTFQEILDTETNYGRDLNILKEEFYEPMKKTCLLNKDQLDSIFLNLDELIHVNTYFLGKLRAAINSANHNNDEDLQDVRIGSLFLESSSMFLTFENYCVNQAQAPVLLEQLEREKELLRIFLHVSQSDNHLLRRMHLKSFLMVPVQRIMKYPMLLDRLYKATPSKHEDKDAIKEAKEKIEDILGHINAKSKVSITGSIKQSQKRKLSERQHCSVSEKIEVLRVALDSLGWNRKDTCDVITSRLQVAVPVDHLWAAKKCRNLKFTSVLGVLLTLGEPSFEQSDKNLVFPNTSSVRSAAVVLIREKNGKYQAVRDPFMLEKCVVSQDPEFTEVFEVLEWNKESLIIKADSQKETSQWVQYLRQQMQQLGCWRKRRNALPNILLNHLAQ